MSNFNIDYLVVAGGGAGGYRAVSPPFSWYCGGGGAGGFLNGSTNLTTGVSIDLNVGAAGAAYSGTYTFARGNKGGNSYISQTGVTTIEAEGGGYGAAIFHASSDPNVTNQNGGPGGSGGGASGWNNVNSTGGTATPSGQGNNGGNGAPGGDGGAGGGGGAGSAGTANSGSGGMNGGNGGNGLQSSITGSPIYYASGAKGGKGYAGTAGTDGNNGTGYRGVSNSGDGGEPFGPSSSGYSGIVILRYATADVSSYTTTGITPTEDTTTVAGQTILSFTTVGTGSITFTAPAPPPPTSSITKVTTPVTNFNKPLTEEGLKIPSGTSSNQPTGVEGMIRNDTNQSSKGSASAITYYNGTDWRYFENQEHPLILNSVMYYSASNATSYPGTGTSWFDLSGNANTATITSSNYSNGYFDLTPTGSIITTPVNTLYQTFSFSIWVKFDTVTVASGYAGVVISKSQFYASNHDAFPFNSNLSSTGNFSVGLSYGNNYSYDVINNTTVSANTWYNIAYVADSTANTAKLYIGTESTQLAQTGSTQSYTGTLVTNPNQFYSLGKSPAEYGGGVGKSSLDGKIAKFGFWDTALTEAELITIWGLGSGTS